MIDPPGCNELRPPLWTSAHALQEFLAKEFAAARPSSRSTRGHYSGRMFHARRAAGDCVANLSSDGLDVDQLPRPEILCHIRSSRSSAARMRMILCWTTAHGDEH